MQAAGYYLRQDIIWEKPNARPHPHEDRLVTSHEYIFLLTKSPKYYFDYEAILEPYTKPMDRWGGDNLKADGISLWDMGTGQNTYLDRSLRPDPRGRRRRSVWNIPTEEGRFAGKHFATFPARLVELCVLAGCPKGGLVLDPFSGSGTTIEVALQHGRRAIGLDISLDYCKLASRRESDGIQAVLL